MCNSVYFIFLRYRKIFFNIIIIISIFLQCELNGFTAYGRDNRFTYEGSKKKSGVNKYKQNNFSTFDGVNGRNVFGVNFATTMYGLLSKPLFLFAADIIRPNAESVGISTPKGKTILGVASSLYYDFALSDFFTLGVEMGVAYMGADFVIIDTQITTLPWSINTKFFPAGNSPTGFYISPKIGATHLFMKGIYFNGVPFSMNTSGFYASVEFGWRIPIFPKAAIASDSRLTLDIALVDVGYYFVSWNREVFNIFSDFGINALDNYKNTTSIRFLPLPKIGFSIVF